MRLWPVLFAGAALMAHPAWAQHTVIIPDGAGSALATGTTIARSGTVSTIDGGTLAGTNLFHSFATFNLAAGDTARWTTTLTDPAKVTNVINRVTGGEVSRIGGTLDSTSLPKAAFFFINPAGIVFGKNASVNVPGAARFSSAKQLRFADGTALSATTASGSTFSVAAPQSFGFLGQEGDIALRGTIALLANPASSLELAGANLPITNAGITASGVSLAAVGDRAADVALGGVGAGPILGGSIRLSGSAIAIIPDSADAAVIRGGDILLQRSSLYTTDGTYLAGSAIRIDAKTLSLTGDAFIQTYGGAAGNSGDIAITLRGALRMRDEARITSFTFGAGHAGALTIKAQTADLSGSAYLSSDSTGPETCLDPSCDATGNAGAITLTAGTLRMRDSARITSDTYGSGHAGALTIKARSADLSGSAYLSSDPTSPAACVDPSCNATGNAGAVTLTAGTLRMRGDARITSNTFGSGHAGALTIKAGTADLSGSAYLQSDSSGRASCRDRSCAASGDAGDITLKAGTLRMRDAAQISSNTLGSGHAGALSLTARTADFSGSAYLSSNSTSSFFCADPSCSATGDAGAISLRAGTLRMREAARISSFTLGSGRAGALTIKADTADFSGSAFLQSDSTGHTSCADRSCMATGDAGAISLTAGTLRMRGDARITSYTFGTGRAGALTIKARTADLSQSAYLSSDSTSPADCPDPSCNATGDAGAISLSAGILRMRGNARITSDTFGSGRAGALTVTAGTADLSGFAYLQSDSSGRGSCRDRSCAASGDAGDITLKAGILRMRDNASITSDTLGSGHAGALTVTAKTADLSGSAYLSSNSTSSFACNDQSCAATGDAGAITLTAGTLRMRDDASISSDTFGSGQAGALTIKADRFALSGYAYLSSDATGSDSCMDPACFATGNAGTITVTSKHLTMRGRPSITSLTLGAGRAGDIRISAAIADIGAGDIATESIACGDGSCRASGAAGNIAIAAGTLLLDRGATVSSATGFTGRAGDVSITANALRVPGGMISSQSTGCDNNACIAGASGEISIKAKTVALTGSSQITTSSASAVQAGNIGITAPHITISGPASIASTNTGTGSGNAPAGMFRAGSVALATTSLVIADGGSITTNSASGPAGQITVTMPQGVGILTLSGRRKPGVITTSSGPGTGGEITISNPLAIISNGGSILAKGQAAGADVRIASRYFIQSADRPNVISVDGSIQLQSNLYDVSAGTAPPNLDFLDASRVLLGQCASARATGETSRISWRNTGPYAFLPVRVSPLALSASGLLEGSPC